MNRPEHLIDDPDVIGLELDDVGWVGVDKDSPRVVELHDYLVANNGIRGLEIAVSYTHLTLPTNREV